MSRLKLMALAGALAWAPAALATAQETPASADGQQTAPSPAPNSPAQQPAGSPATPPEAAVAAPATPDFALVFNVGASNDYVFRGISQTDNGPQLFGGADLTYKSFYAGTWLSNVDFKPFGDTKTSLEFDLYGGYKKELYGYAFDVGAIYYGYGGQPRGAAVDYFEGYVKGTRAIGPVTLGGSLFVSPEFSGKIGTTVYVEGNASYTVNKQLTLSGAVGHQSIQDIAGDYLTWNLGGTYALTDKIGIDVRYWDTDQHGFGEPYGSKGVVSLKANFP